MRNKKVFVSVVLILVLTVPIKLGVAIEGRVASEKARAFVGQDLHLSGGELLLYQSRPGEPRPSEGLGEHILVLQDGFSM